METIIAYVLGILTVFLIGMAVGMFMVMRRTNQMRKEIDSLNLELNNSSMDLYRSIESDRNEVDKVIQDIYREVESKREEVLRHIEYETTNINRSVDSRLNKLENKLIPSDATKTLLKG